MLWCNIILSILLTELKIMNGRSLRSVSCNVSCISQCNCFPLCGIIYKRRNIAIVYWKRTSKLAGNSMTSKLANMKCIVLIPEPKANDHRSVISWFFWKWLLLFDNKKMRILSKNQWPAWMMCQHVWSKKSWFIMVFKMIPEQVPIN